MSHPAITTDDERANLERIKAYAEDHPFPLSQVLEAFLSQQPLVTDKQHAAYLSNGLLVVLSIETHPSGPCRHLSVGLVHNQYKQLPTSAHIQEIGQAVGMRMDLFDTRCSTSFRGRPPHSVSVLELIEES